MVAGSKQFYEPACPYLGTVHDPAVHCGYATRENVCYAQAHRKGIDVAFQESHCLSHDHVNCSRYQTAAGTAPAPGAPALAPRVEPEHESEPEPTGFPLRTVLIGIVAVLVVVFVVTQAARVNGPSASSMPPAQPAALTIEPPTVLPADAVVTPATAAPSALPSPLPATRAAAQPTDTPETANTATPTPLPSPTPAVVTTPPAALTPAAGAPYVIVRLDPLNARLGPGSDYGITGVVYANDRFEANGRTESGDWVQICCVGGQPAWVATEYVTVSVPVTDLAMLPVPPVLYPPPAP